MRGLLAVLRKEVLDNIRDRQSVFYALLFGPVLIPVLVCGALVAGLKQAAIDYDDVVEIGVLNGDTAPNLIAYLREHNLLAVDAPADFEDTLRNGTLTAVLEITDEYGDKLRAGEPAPLIIHYNEADKQSDKSARRAARVLSAYEQTIANLRMQVRGLEPVLFDALSVVEKDVSPEGGDRQFLSSLLPFLFIVSMIMGGFYLAIDTTAGERERRSLEPLLALPLPRWQIVLGKYGATMVFVLLSLTLTALGIYLIFRLFPISELAPALQFDAGTLFLAWLITLPLMLLITSLLITIAALTRSSKQAQTYLGLLMVIPMLPFFLLQFVSWNMDSISTLIPMLSQYKLLEQVTLGEPLASGQLMISVVSTLLAAAILVWLAVVLYRQDRILQ